jgi:hypothetical protein
MLLGWLLAPLCAGFLVAFLNSYDEGDDNYSRLMDQYPRFPVWQWIAAVSAGAVIAVIATRISSRAGLLCTALVAVASLVPIIVIGLSGH